MPAPHYEPGAYREGWAAFEAGQKVDTNPYTVKRYKALFRAGFADAKKEAKR